MCSQHKMGGGYREEEAPTPPFLPINGRWAASEPFTNVFLDFAEDLDPEVIIDVSHFAIHFAAGTGALIAAAIFPNNVLFVQLEYTGAESEPVTLDYDGLNDPPIMSLTGKTLLSLSNFNCDNP